MEHLMPADFMLLQARWGLSQIQRAQMKQHLESCVQCQQQFRQIQEKRRHHRTEAAGACDYFQKQFYPYGEGLLNSNQTHALEQHLHECDDCQSRFQILASLPDWETVAQNSPPLPPATRVRIENVVLAALAKARSQPEWPAPLPNLKETLQQAIPTLKLMLRPFQPDFAYRSEFPEETQVIEHAGGELILETSVSDVTIELTSIFEESVHRGQTDSTGQAHFNNLPKGDYLVHVEGYHLIEVKVVSPPPTTTS
ncbi:carboxypeptidase-like regulatory domain-containing protein [candidate division KSB1 bacterium]|nr:carboxypeptidase-like regulatory domain-containing protein [candidate division KSB1 bacterium]